jgi:methyl-accepting chemotaxis protein
MAGFVRHWASRAGMLRRIIESAGAEIKHASGDMETETAAVVESFRDVAGKAKSQSDRISAIASMAGRVSVDGDEIELGAMATLFDHILDDILSKIGALSGNALAMVGVLEGMSKSIDHVEACIGKVEGVNRQANMLAVNARIEAARAGGTVGQAFGVVANELGHLSQSTNSLAGTMRDHMAEVVRAIRDSRTALQEVASVDMSGDIERRSKLDRLVEAMIQRGVDLGQIVTEAASDQHQISAQISAIVTGMQFQDRVNQRLEQVLDTLTIIGDAVGEWQQESGGAPGDDPGQTPGDVAWLKGLSARYKLSEMRARFVARVIDGDSDGETPAAQSGDSEAGSVELF